MHPSSPSAVAQVPARSVPQSSAPASPTLDREPTDSPSPTPAVIPSATDAPAPPPHTPSAPAHPPAAAPPTQPPAPAAVTVDVPVFHQAYNLSCEESSLS